MTTARRLAVKILSAVVRLASPGSKDWANAMLRELDFIENDWTALFWALGCTRILFTSQEAPVADISDIRQAARQMRRSDASDGLATLITIALFGAAIRFHSPIQRLGGAFIGASLLYSAYQHFALRVREVPDGADASAYASLFRANLVRQRDLHRGWRLWSRLAMMFAGFVLLYVGRIPAAPGSAQRIALTVAFAAAPAFIVQSIRQKAHKYQRQIDELDALPKGL